MAASAGGVFGKIAGQSGKLAPENMLYSDWNDCMQGAHNDAGVGAVDETYFGQIWWGNGGNMWLLNDVVILPWE